MKQKDIATVVGVAVFTAIIAFIFSSLIFKVPSGRKTEVPVAGSIDTTFPDLNHDTNYNTIFNDNALDPAVPLNNSGAPNNQPFNGSQ